MRVIAGFLAFLLLAMAQLSAQEPRLQVSVDTSVVSVGDRIKLTVSVDHHPGARLAWPDSLALTPFEVLGAEVPPPVSQGETTRSSMVLVLAAFELGDLEIPSFEIQVTDPEGEVTTLSTSRYGIQVLTVGLDDGGDIREIRGPMGIPADILSFLLLFLAVAAAAILARIVYRRVRKSEPEHRNTEPAAPWRPPHEVALEELERLERSPLLKQGEVKKYHIEVSDIIRTYIEGRFQVPALEMTTRDILPGLPKRSLEAESLDGFGRFLAGCDLVKFAKYRPDHDASQAILALGRRLVRETIPAPDSYRQGPEAEEAAYTRRADGEPAQGPTAHHDVEVSP